MEIPEIKGIQNEIVVMGAADEDSAIAKRVRSDILQDPLVDVSGLRVSVRSGVVTLHGTVSTSKEKNRVDNFAWGISDVRAIVNDILVVSIPIKY